MKRVFTFFLLSVLVLSASAQDNYIWFPEEVVHLEEGDPQEYTQKIWYEGAMPGGGYHYGPIGIWNYANDFEFSYEVISGDLVVTSLAPSEDPEGLKVTFTGEKGAILISARNNGNFDGTLYSCSYVLYYGNVSKRWDFNTAPFTVRGESWWWGQETHMSGANNHPAYTPFNYAMTYNDTGDRGPEALVAEAEGLRFDVAAGAFGYHNPGVDDYVMTKKNGWQHDPTSDANIETRFICFKAGSKLTIHSSNFANFKNPRVRIKMNRDGHSTLNLNIYNAKDAVGKEIKTDNGYYGIGGCSWWGWKDDAEHKNKYDYLYRGEYHFQIINPEQDFVIEVPTSANQDQSNDWLMIYSIEVYDSKEMITENSVLGDNYQFLTKRITDGNNVTQTVTPAAAYYTHYRGKAETTTFSNATVSGTVGTLGQNTYSANESENKFLNRFTTTGDTEKKHTYTPEPGEFGTFRIRLEVHTHGENNYVTDYAYRTMSCGLLENKIYPYTWDLTDIKTYLNSNFRDDKGVETVAANKMALEAKQGYALQPTPDYEKGITYIPRNLWEANEDGTYGLRVANEAGNYNVMFCDGSQLWYGNTIIPETAGLSFLPNNFDGLYNGAMTLTSGGLQMDQDQTAWWKWRIVVPQVSSDCTIYVRAKQLKEDNENTNYIVGYVFGDTGNKDPYTDYNAATATLDGKARVVGTVGDDVIFAIPGPSPTKNVTLFFNGVEVHKIAVSKDPKTVNKYGWATESRDHVIDQELTSYFTGRDFVTYLVDEVNNSKTSVTLSEVTMTSNVMEKSNGSDYNAYIIRNKDAEILKDEDGNVVKDDNDEVVATGKVDILNTGGGFHLFVPDIHDYVKIGENTSDYNQKSVNTYKSLLKAKLNSGPVNKNETIDGVEYTNFVLTWQVADITEGQQGSQYDFENVGFFRVQDAGIQSKGNQGYLPLILASGNTTNKYNIVWDDDTNGIDATITDSIARRNDNVFYNLSGQRLNGVPTKGGIYIVNGKKIVVK